MSAPPGYGLGLLLTLVSLPLALWRRSTLRKEKTTRVRRTRSVRWVSLGGTLLALTAFCSTALRFGFVFGKELGDGFGEGYVRALPLLGIEVALILLFAGAVVTSTQKRN